VVDAALAVTGCERGFLLLRSGTDKDADLDVSVARDSNGRELLPDDLRVPRHLIRQALASRRELLSMSFDPFEEQGRAARDDSSSVGVAQCRVPSAHPAA